MDRVDIELQALIAEREGMVAENIQRQARGYSMAYVMDEFVALAEKMRALKEEKETCEWTKIPDGIQRGNFKRACDGAIIGTLYPRGLCGRCTRRIVEKE